MELISPIIFVALVLAAQHLFPAALHIHIAAITTTITAPMTSPSEQ